MSDPALRVSPAAFGESSGFRPAARFAREDTHEGFRERQAPQAGEEPDPVAAAYEQGFAEGAQQAREEAAALAEAEAAAREALGLSFARIDKAMEEELRVRLRETVAALCETAIAPLAIDGAALADRVARAAAMLARADDERVIRLNPDDLAIVSASLKSDWTVEPDPALERGTVRIEGANGGVEDGPATWRRAIAEAIGEC
ncbi:MAG: FliH/SctL family protein [Sphingomonadaceae bacterium]|jgi:flagellar assembly protein FliH